MTVIHSFPPVLSATPSKLILGSMPGKRSLQDNQYYAHPRNAFWPIMCTLLNSNKNHPEKGRLRSDRVSTEKMYAERLITLKKANIALWDVLQACTRASSLDSDIVESTIVVNDFAALLTKHKTIKHIYFNGAKAEQLYKRHVIPTLGEQEKCLPMTRLPSTSPAHAAMRFEDKMQIWEIIR